jgi:hypothetical protein
MAYTYDIPDDGVTADDGDVEGFFGLLLLGHSTDPTGRDSPSKVGIHTAVAFRGDGSYPAGEPRNDFERYDALSKGIILNRPTGEPADYKWLVSVGPFRELVPGESLQLDLAFVVGEGYYDTGLSEPHPELGADGLPSDNSLLANAIRARLVYEGRWKDIDGARATGVDGRETCIETESGDPYVWVNPCDSTDVRIFEGSTCDDPSSWVDNDCNPCTPNPAHEGCTEGCERLIHWYTLPTIGTQPNIPPVDRLRAGVLSLAPMRVPSTPPIRFLLTGVGSAPHRCEVGIFDVAGRLVRGLGKRTLSSGTSEWIWDGRDRNGLRVAPGIYFIRAQGEGETVSRQLVVLKH